MDNQTKIKAYNGLNFITAFKSAYAAQNMEGGAIEGERVSIEHMETLIFMVNASDTEGVELRNLQKFLDYPQAKMHRTIATLCKLGWLETDVSKEDTRQKSVSMTQQGLDFFEMVSKFLSDRPTASDMGRRSEAMVEEIKDDAARRETLLKLSKSQDKLSMEVEDLASEILKSGKPVAEEHMREVIRGFLVKKGERDVEVGKNYIATRQVVIPEGRNRGEESDDGPSVEYRLGIVTFSVLMKRTETTNLVDLYEQLKKYSTGERKQKLRPTPRSQKDKILEYLDNMTASYGPNPDTYPPSLRVQYGKLRSKLAGIEAEEKANATFAAKEGGQ